MIFQNIHFTIPKKKRVAHLLVRQSHPCYNWWTFFLGRKMIHNECINIYFHSISFIGNQNDPNQTKASQQTKQQQQLRKLQQKHQQQHQQQQNHKKCHTVNSKTDITKVTPGKKKNTLRKIKTLF